MLQTVFITESEINLHPCVKKLTIGHANKTISNVHSSDLSYYCLV